MRKSCDGGADHEGTAGRQLPFGGQIYPLDKPLLREPLRLSNIVQNAVIGADNSFTGEAGSAARLPVPAVPGVMAVTEQDKRIDDEQEYEEHQYRCH